MRHLFAFALASLFAFTADAAPPQTEAWAAPVSPLQSIVVGVVATGAQVTSYGVCFLMLAREDTCVTVADRTMRVFTSAR